MDTNLVYLERKSTKHAYLTEEAKVAFAGFITAKTLREAVASLLPVFGKRVLEPKKANASIWGGTFEFDGLYFSNGEEANYNSLMKKIKPGGVATVVVGDDIIVVTHVAKYFEQGGSTKAHLRFNKSVVL